MLPDYEGKIQKFFGEPEALGALPFSMRIPRLTPELVALLWQSTRPFSHFGKTVQFHKVRLLISVVVATLDGVFLILAARHMLGEAPAKHRRAGKLSSLITRASVHNSLVCAILRITRLFVLFCGEFVAKLLIMQVVGEGVPQFQLCRWDKSDGDFARSRSVQLH